MSETTALHTQWIQHAIAAAKAGNPSVAKIQLQKAAEESPGDPAIWLWMGWLADSPSSAAQCLEIAKFAARFEKIAVAGIEFARALAEFQLDQTSEAEFTNEPAEEFNTPNTENKESASRGPVNDPVESVEGVVAAVESLQHEDAAETNVVDETAEAESVAESEELIEQVQASAVNVDQLPTSEPVAAETTSECEVVESSEAECQAPAIQNSDAANQAESDSAHDVEAELMKSASELWQTANETSSANDDSVEEVEPGQQLWQSTDDQKKDTTEARPAGSAETPAQSEPATPSQPEALVDESEDDFTFASDDTDADFDSAEPSSEVEASPVRININPSLNAGDDWLGQNPVETPKAPVWRKAQSDWFSVDAPAEPETQPAASSPDVSVEPAEQQPLTIENDPLPVEAVDEKSTPESKVDHPVQQKMTPTVVPRVTASDVWQTAAIEKSELMNVPAAQPPTYQAPASSIQPPPVNAVPASTAFFDADARIESPSGGSTNGTPLDRKTVLVVDDSPTVRKLVAITLEKRGYKVVAAFDGVAAIKEIAAHNPSLILMDVNMPRLDGYQLCKLVKKHETTRDIPVLMLTGKDGMFDRLRGRLVGCAGSIAKPFSPEDLLEIVEQNIAQVN